MNRSRAGTGPRRRPTRPPAHRLVALLAVLMLGFGGVLVRLVVLQVADASAYQELARDQRLRVIELPAARGAVLDRHGEELAMSVEARAVFADPTLVREPLEVARTVAAALDLDVSTVHDRLTAPDTRFVYIERGVDVPTAERLARRELPGIGFLEESRRAYPGRIAPHVVGAVGVDGEGLEGLEFRYDDVLAGTPGRAVVEEDPTGTSIPQAANSDVPPVRGRDLVLTIDEHLQFQAQRALARTVRENRARAGSVIVMDPRTGDVLAMANVPTFDPNDLGASPAESRRNRAVQDLFEPGSVNKVIAAAAALERGVVRTDQRLSVPDHLQVWDHDFTDAHPHAPLEMTLADIVTHSSNIGAIQVAQLIGGEAYASYLYGFGFGMETEVGFPGEPRGLVPSYEDWSGITLPSIAIGQGVAVTALQMTAVYATIANGGIWVRPRLVLGTRDAAGRLIPAPPPATRRVISEETARTLTEMLAFAVTAGTGSAAQLEGHWVAGKTGTAQKPLVDERGYGDERVASFIGFTPASRPALVVAAVLDNPRTVYGGIAAAPLFQDVARFALVHLRIPTAAAPPTPPHAVPTD